MFIEIKNVFLLNRTKDWN